MSYFKISGVNYILIREDGKILIEKRDNKTLIAPNEYCIPGGKIENGESPDEAIVRVIEKETGISIARFNFSYFCGLEYKIRKKKKFNLIYVIKVTLETVIASIPTQSNLKWCDVEEIDELNLVYNENDILQKVRILF